MGIFGGGISAGRRKKKKDGVFEPAIVFDLGRNHIWNWRRGRVNIEAGKVEIGDKKEIDLPSDYTPEYIKPYGKSDLAYMIQTVEGVPIKNSIDKEDFTNENKLHPILSPTHMQQKNEKKSLKIIASARNTLSGDKILMMIIMLVMGVMIGIVAAPYLPTATQHATTIIQQTPPVTKIP